MCVVAFALWPIKCTILRLPSAVFFCLLFVVCIWRNKKNNQVALGFIYVVALWDLVRSAVKFFFALCSPGQRNQNTRRGTLNSVRKAFRFDTAMVRRYALHGSEWESIRRIKTPLKSIKIQCCDTPKCAQFDWCLQRRTEYIPKNLNWILKMHKMDIKITMFVNYLVVADAYDLHQDWSRKLKSFMLRYMPHFATFYSIS